MLHYYPRHVSSINMPIFRRKNCIHIASGIVALCKRPQLHSTPVESGLQSALKLLNEIILYYEARSKKHQITTVQENAVDLHSVGRVPQQWRRQQQQKLKDAVKNTSL